MNELFESKGIGCFPSHGWACTDANMSTYERQNVGPLGGAEQPQDVYHSQMHESCPTVRGGEFGDAALISY